MPELNFKITGDDSSLRKTLEGVATYSKDINDKLTLETSKSLTAEAKAREKAKKDAVDLAQMLTSQGPAEGTFGSGVLSPKQVTRQKEPVGNVATDDDYRKETQKLEQELERQKLLYHAFDKWKNTYGEESAKKRYAAELDTSKTYFEKIKAEYSKLVFKSVVGTITNRPGLTKPETEREAGLSARLNDESSYQSIEQSKQYDIAYKAAETLAQKELSLRKDYKNNVETLSKEQNGVISADQQKVLDEGLAISLKTVKEEAQAKSAIYKKMGEDALALARADISKEIKNLRSVLKDSSITGGAKTAIEAQLTSLEGTLNLNKGDDKKKVESKNDFKKQRDVISAKLANLKSDTSKPEDSAEIEKTISQLGEVQGKVDGTKSKVGKLLKGVGNSFKSHNSLTAISADLQSASGAITSLGAGLEGSDPRTAYTLNGIGKLAGAAGDVAGAIASKDPVKMISATVKAVGTLFSMSNKVKAMNEAARKEATDFYDAVVKGETQYQVLLRKRGLSEAGKGKNSYQAIISQLDVLKEQSPEIQAAYDKVFESLQGGSSKEGVGYEHGTWLKKAKTWDIMASLAGSDYDKLEQLDAQGKLVGVEKTNFADLKKLREELDAAGVSTENLQKQLGGLLTGTSTSQLADGLKSLFENGKRSAQDFGDSFESIIKNSLLSSFKAKYLEDALEPFYNDLTAMMKNGTPSEKEIGALKDKYIGIGQKADEELKAIEKITGKSLSKDAPANTNTIQGSVQNISASQADVLTGHFAGMRLAQLDGNGLLQSLGLTGIEQLNVAKSNIDVALRIEANTFRTANNTNRLETMEASLASIDAKMSDPDNAKRAAGWN